MRKTAAAAVAGTLAFLALPGCSETRTNPCQFLSVTDAKSVDSAVTVSRWVGRDEPAADDEVCMFYTDAGDPRMMLFVWYGNDVDPRRLVRAGSDGDATILELSDPDLSGYTSFRDDELQLLAARSAERTVGLRVRKPVPRGSADFDDVVQLAKLVLSR